MQRHDNCFKEDDTSCTTTIALDIQDEHHKEFEEHTQTKTSSDFVNDYNQQSTWKCDETYAFRDPVSYFKELHSQKTGWTP
eukprot:6265148-Amphidinium_carterae.1